MYNPHPLLALVILCAVALMVVAGLGKNKLELRRIRHICPSCGLQLDDCSCRR